eukprot:4601666-Heterocapsa_arctica.AAC.1
MGWSWSVHWVQAIHMEVFRRAGIPGPWMQDKAPLQTPQVDGVTRALYIDNFCAFGFEQDVMLVARDEMRHALAGVGVVSYLDGEVDSEGDFLGFALKGRRRWELTQRKFWKITLGLRWALRPGARISSRGMERLLGHVVSALA